MSQETLLHGAVTRKWQDRDRLGRVYEEEETEEREPPKDIVLTISSSIQYKTEEALEKGVKFANAKSGMAIVLDPKTGEILAMANYPSFDPNRSASLPPKIIRIERFKGSIRPAHCKLITYGSALDEFDKPGRKIDCRAVYRVAKHRLRPACHESNVL